MKFKIGKAKDKMKKKKILIVDDEETLLIGLEVILSNAGYDVLKAGSGKEALTTAKSQLPDLIMLDIRMPDMDGDKIADFLKNDEATRKIPIVYQTCLVDKDEVEDGHVLGSKIGNQYFIAKPYDKDEILCVVKQII